jgi:predicted acetyltransferase
MNTKSFITLSRVTISDAQSFLDLQVKSFAAALEKYQDYETSPANETVERIIEKIQQPHSHLYFIICDGVAVGGIRIIWTPEDLSCRVSPIFILPQHQGKGMGHMVMKAVEKLYPEAKLWMHSTILEEAGLCKFYEELGHTRVWTSAAQSGKLTLAYYEKKVT